MRLVLGDKAYRQRPLQAEMHEIGVALDGDSPPLPKRTTFRPMPMRWRIEQFFAWFCKGRRVAKNWCFTESAQATDVAWALFATLLRKVDKEAAKLL